MSDLYRYRVKGRSLTIPGRIIRLTVTAANADDARAMARIKVPDFGTTVESPRRGAKLEQPDPIDEAKREADRWSQPVENWDTARWRDTDVEVI